MEMLYSVSKRRDNLSIKDTGKTVVFSWTTCFDYDEGDWDNFSITIPKKTFLEKIGEFVKNNCHGRCEIKGKNGAVAIYRSREGQKITYELTIETRDARDGFTSHSSGVDKRRVNLDCFAKTFSGYHDFET